MKRTLLSILVLASLCPVARATPQAGTPLTINGTNHYVYGFALRKDMAERFRANRDKRVVIRSSNWGGCNATLEVRGKKLYLTSLDIDRPGRPWPFNGPSVRTMFGVTIPEDGLFADWFIGELEEGIGEKIILYSGITQESRFCQLGT